MQRLELSPFPRFEGQPVPIMLKINIDSVLIRFIAKRGLRLKSIPEEGDVVQLRPHSRWVDGSTLTEIADELSPELIELGRRAAFAAGASLAGVDIIATDINNLNQSKIVINEVNTTPGLLPHYVVTNREAVRDVYSDVLKVLFDLSVSTDQATLPNDLTK